MLYRFKCERSACKCNPLGGQCLWRMYLNWLQGPLCYDFDCPNNCTSSEQTSRATGCESARLATPAYAEMGLLAQAARMLRTCRVQRATIVEEHATREKTNASVLQAGVDNYCD